MAWRVAFAPLVLVACLEARDVAGGGETTRGRIVFDRGLAGERAEVLGGRPLVIALEGDADIYEYDLAPEVFSLARGPLVRRSEGRPIPRPKRAFRLSGDALVAIEPIDDWRIDPIDWKSVAANGGCARRAESDLVVEEDCAPPAPAEAVPPAPPTLGECSEGWSPEVRTILDTAVEVCRPDPPTCGRRYGCDSVCPTGFPDPSDARPRIYVDCAGVGGDGSRGAPLRTLAEAIAARPGAVIELAGQCSLGAAPAALELHGRCRADRIGRIDGAPRELVLSNLTVGALAVTVSERLSLGQVSVGRLDAHLVGASADLTELSVTETSTLEADRAALALDRVEFGARRRHRFMASNSTVTARRVAFDGRAQIVFERSVIDLDAFSAQAPIVVRRSRLRGDRLKLGSSSDAPTLFESSAVTLDRAVVDGALGIVASTVTVRDAFLPAIGLYRSALGGERLALERVLAREGESTLTIDDSMWNGGPSDDADGARLHLTLRRARLDRIELAEGDAGVGSDVSLAGLFVSAGASFTGDRLRFTTPKACPSTYFDGRATLRDVIFEVATDSSSAECKNVLFADAAIFSQTVQVSTESRPPEISIERFRSSLKAYGAVVRNPAATLSIRGGLFKDIGIAFDLNGVTDLGPYLEGVRIDGGLVAP